MKYLIILTVGLLSSTTHAQTTKDSIGNNLKASANLRAASLVLSGISIATFRQAVKNQYIISNGQPSPINLSTTYLVGAFALVCEAFSIGCLNRAGQLMKRP